MVDDIDVMQLRARVLELEGRIEYLYKHLNIAYVKEISEGEKMVVDILKTGNMLEAIKVYREIYKVDGGSAKAAVEALKAQLDQ